MAISVKKELALQLYCLARQVERSIDVGLHSPEMWQEMLVFFTGERKARVESAERALRALLPHENWPQITRDDIRGRRLYLLPLYLGRIAINRFRTGWRFSAAEVGFLARTFASLVVVLQLREKPLTDDLVNLRLDLAACQWIIGERLMGVRALQTTQRIEHYGQAPHVTPMKWEDLFPSQAVSSCSNDPIPGELRKTA